MNRRRPKRLDRIAGIGVDRMGSIADASGGDFLRLENLDVDIPPDPEAIERTRRAASEDADNSYLPFIGQSRLREAASRHVSRLSGVAYSGERNCIVSAGGLSGILNVLLATIEIGDEVIVTDPTYAGLINRVCLAGGVPRFVPFRFAPGGAWTLDRAALRDAVGPKTRAMLLMSPSMPSGGTLDSDDWALVAELCGAADLILILDTAMERLLFDGRAVVHPAGLPGMAERTITVGSSAKELRMIGWRVGWIVAPETFMPDLVAVSLANVVVPPEASGIARPPGRAPRPPAIGWPRRSSRVLPRQLMSSTTALRPKRSVCSRAIAPRKRSISGHVLNGKVRPNTVIPSLRSALQKQTLAAIFCRSASYSPARTKAEGLTTRCAGWLKSWLPLRCNRTFGPRTPCGALPHSVRFAPALYYAWIPLASVEHRSPPAIGLLRDHKGKMRIERRGHIERLTPRVVGFIRGALGGVSMDELRSPEERRIDYACLNGLLAIELKTLEEDASERLGNLTDKLRQRPDWPEFYGTWTAESVIMNMAEPEAVQRQMLDRIGRALVSHLKKADGQLAAHEGIEPRKNLVRVMLLINEDHEVYEPSAVGYVLARELSRQKETVFAYQHVDAVLYMSERHATALNGRVAFPVMMIEGPAMTEARWKSGVLQRFARGWAEWNEKPLFGMEAEAPAFTTIDPIPEQAPRHERWRTGYRRAPYLQHLSLEQLREKWDEAIVISLLAFIKGSPLKPGSDDVAANMERFTHLMEETARRGVPLSAFRFESERNVAATKRLENPDQAVAWISTIGGPQP